MHDSAVMVITFLVILIRIIRIRVGLIVIILIWRIWPDFRLALQFLQVPYFSVELLIFFGHFSICADCRSIVSSRFLTNERRGFIVYGVNHGV